MKEADGNVTEEKRDEKDLAPKRTTSLRCQNRKGKEN